ncbi:MAG: hypothetical protein AB8G11_11580 [Saprospiraceae bacterium]
MKRRFFLSATGVAVATGVTSGLSAASGSFNKMSAFVSLQEFSSKSKNVLDNFVNQLEQHMVDVPQKSQIIKNLAMPVRIITKESSHKEEKVVYTNKAGNYIKLSVKNGKETIHIYNTPIYK